MRIASLFFIILLGCKSQQLTTPEIIAGLDHEKEISVISFGSCAHQANPQPLWTIIQKQKPDLYIALGDNIYASSPKHGTIPEAYPLQASIPEFKKFRADIPIIATWDDHDFGLNDGGKENPDKDLAKSHFLKFFPHDAKVINNTGGIEHSFLLGPKGKRIHIIFLDTRWYRDPLVIQDRPKNELDKFKPTTDPSTTILGENQWQWLESEFAKKADLRILVSSIQVVASEHGFEKWANFPHEKKRLYQLLNNSKTKTIILSGDRHAGEISKDKKIIDITASGINRTSTITEETNKYRLGARETKENFGLIRINWASRKATVELIGLNAQPITNSVVKF